MPARRKAAAPTTAAKKIKTTYIYKLNRGGGIITVIPSSNITVYDEAKNSVREIRYCSNQQSIYVDEQKGQATREPLKFFEGILAVPHTKPNLVKFMESHPMNTKNGGKLFHLVETEKDNEKSVEEEFLTHDAISLVKDKTAEELEPIGMHFGIKLGESISDFKFSLLKVAKRDPKKFIESFDDPVVAMKAKLMRAVDFGIVTMKDSGAYWSDTNGIIVATPTGYSSINTLTQHCLTDKGSSTYAKIESELDKINK